MNDQTVGIGTIRERKPHTVIEIISHLMEADKQINLIKEDNEWVISYTHGSPHQPENESPGVA